MCICINCKHINYCRTYSFIESQHTIQSSLKNVEFTPKQTIIHINLKIHDKTYILDWDLVECLSFAEQPGSWEKITHL